MRGPFPSGCDASVKLFHLSHEIMELYILMLLRYALARQNERVSGPQNILPLSPKDAVCRPRPNPPDPHTRRVFALPFTVTCMVFGIVKYFLPYVAATVQCAAL